MDVYLFARFHARDGSEHAVQNALREVVAASRDETGCLAIHAFHSVRDSREFYLHSHWKDQAAFNTHAEQPHTVRFMELMPQLIDHEFRISLAESFV